MLFYVLFLALSSASLNLKISVDKTFWSESQPQLEAKICLVNEGSTFRFLKSGTPFGDAVTGFSITAVNENGVVAEHVIPTGDVNSFDGEKVIGGTVLCKTLDLNDFLVFQESGKYEISIKSSFYPCGIDGCDEASIMALQSISPTELNSNVINVEVDAEATATTQHVTAENNLVLTETVPATSGCVWRSFTGHLVAVRGGSTQIINGASTNNFSACKNACMQKSNCHGFMVLSNNRCRVFDSVSIIVSGRSTVYACRTAWRSENLWKTTNPNGKSIETWFQGCNAQKKNQIKDGYNSFKKLCEFLPSFLNTGTEYYQKQFELYFDNKDEGARDRQLFNERVRTRVEQVQRICDASNFGFSCVECSSGVLAYVYKGDKTHTIHLCDFEFSRRNRIMPGKIATSFADTIFHEFSHFADLASTDDSPSYSHSYALRLAKEDPSRAMQIASNFDKWATYTEDRGTQPTTGCAAGKVRVSASAVSSGFDLSVSTSVRDGQSTSISCPAPLKGKIEVSCANKRLQVRNFGCTINDQYSIVFDGFKCSKGYGLTENADDCLKAFKDATGINVGNVRPNSANFLAIRPPACHYKGNTLWFNSNKDSEASASFEDYMICVKSSTGPVCGNGVCETGEVDRFCFQDCKSEFTKKICTAARAEKLCDEKCPALSFRFPDLYAAGICGGIFGTKDTYTDFCESKGLSCPSTKPVCGDGVCQAGEVDSFCFKDCKQQFAKKVCDAARKENLCDEKCPALSSKFPQLYAAGLCGGIFEDKDTYSVFCQSKSLSCPSQGTGNTNRFVPPIGCVCKPVTRIDGTKVDGKCFSAPTTQKQVCYVSPAANCVGSFIKEGHFVYCIDREIQVQVGSRRTKADDYKIIFDGLCKNGYENIDSLDECKKAFPLVSGYSSDPTTQSSSYRNKRAAGCHLRMVGGTYKLWFNPNKSSKIAANDIDYIVCRKELTSANKHKSSTVCVNKHTSCASWKSYCETHESFMEENCAKTCGLC